MREAQGVDGQRFDLVVVGTGFAGMFFLSRYLSFARPGARVLILERGEARDHRWQLQNRDALSNEAETSFVNQTAPKPWVFNLSMGGGSNCWWACTPRFLPEDFELFSRYGVGDDWPVSYSDLEEYYCDAEDLMSVAGPDPSPFERSRPYPQPPHRLTEPDRRLEEANPGAFFSQPTARPSMPVASGRPRCCASGVCSLCPIDSKFTILNEMSGLFRDPRVTVLTGARVEALDASGSSIDAVMFRKDGRLQRARADFVALAANAIFNPHILRLSGLDGAHVGSGLVEQVSVSVRVRLDGLDNYQGSTSVTGHGYMMYSGDHRATRAAALIETMNIPVLREERGKWRQLLDLKFIFEDLPDPSSVVALDVGSRMPLVSYAGYSAYLQRGIDALQDELPRLLSPLPIEDYAVRLPEPSHTESHALGTTRMSSSAETGVVDAALVHHRCRNLAVLGGSTFPTVSPANPTLTICALSLRSADRLFGRARAT